ncbi:MAG TPA: cytosine permease [Actinomycetota bacterium]|nr:cytosine permease [Actinomycetota bacterium]
MATVPRRLARTIERETPTWGIRPVPSALRTLGAVDIGVLWGDLSIGLLVLLTGALLVPALGLPTALAAIVVGTIIGCVPLALMGVAGAREGVPAMVLFRAVLGLRGSWLPTAANLLQLVGWTTFEFWAMTRVADAVARDLVGFSSPVVWLVIVAVVCVGLALAGPIFTVRRWLARFGVWVVAVVALWLTFRLLTVADLGALWSTAGAGGLPFWLAVDLVIAMPVSWLPLVADYDRFATSARAAAAGTFGGYALGNLWFYALGVLLVLAAGSAPDVLDIGTTIAATAGGGVVLLALLVGESDQAMANVYSSAVTVQNVAPDVPQRALIVGVGIVGAIGAAILGDDAAITLESFLLLLGSVFVPLAAVFFADWLVRHRGRYGEQALFGNAAPGIRWRAIAPWLMGFAAYQICAPSPVAWWQDLLERTLGAIGVGVPVAGGALGGSMPGFAVAFVVALAVLPRLDAPTVPRR